MKPFSFKESFQQNRLYWVLGGLSAASLIAHLIVWPTLPEILPSHWNVAGQVDGSAPKLTALFLDALPLLLLVLFRVIPSIDPKKESYRRSGKAWPICVSVTTVLLALMSWAPELTVWGAMDGDLVRILVCGGLGALFLAMGNYMPQIKQNYTFGIKTPWALDNAHNWQRTHRMAGFVFTGIGVLMVITALVGGRLLAYGVPAAVLIGTAWLYLYSYLIFIGKMK